MCKPEMDTFAAEALSIHSDTWSCQMPCLELSPPVFVFWLWPWPNPGLIPDFLDMIRRNDFLIQDPGKRRVFVSAIFEIPNGYALPNSKSELVDLFRKEIVIPFHQKLCPECHGIPGVEKWIEDLESGDFQFYCQIIFDF